MTSRKNKTTWSLDKHRILRKFVILFCLIPIFGLLDKDNFFVYEYRGTYMEDKIHGNLFSEFLDKVLEYGSKATFVLFLLGMLLLILAEAGKFFENEMEHRFHTMGLSVCTFAGIFYAIAVIVIGESSMSWQDMEWLYLILLVLGIILSIHSFVAFKGTHDEFKQAKKLTKVVAYLATGIITVGVLVYFGISIREDYSDVLEVKTLIRNQRQERSQDIEYQIGNYSTGQAVYADGNLYLIDKGNTISRINKDGYKATVHEEPSLRKIKPRGLYYVDGYLYYSFNSEEYMVFEEYNGIARTSLNTDETQDVVNSTESLYFGIVDNSLYYMSLTDLDYYARVRDELGVDDAEEINVLDLNTLYTDNDERIYDKGVYLEYSHTYWLTRYIYNNQYDYWKSCEDVDYVSPIEQPYKDGVFYLGTDDLEEGILYKIVEREGKKRERELMWRWITIDKDVCAYNLFNGRIYYMREATDGTYELWSCNTEGEDKKQIRTISAKDRYDYDAVNEYCTRLYVCPDYVVCDFTPYSTGESYGERYVIRIADGEIIKQ